MQLQTNILNNFAISRFNEYYLPSINRSIFEGLDSKTIYDGKFKKAFSQKDRLNIIVGMDSGLLANYILEEGIPDGSKFIIVELSSVLPLLVIDIPTELQKKLIIIDESQFDETLKLEDIKLFIAKTEYSIYSSLAVASKHIEDYNTLLNTVESRLQSEHFENQINFTQKIFVQTQLNNIPDNHSQAKLLRNKFNGKTSIVIAGGPSLDDNIDWIKENQKDLFIFSVSRIAGRLVNYGITPDIVVSVDPQEVSFDVSRGMFDLTNETLFVNSYHVSPKILSQWPGKSLYMGQRLPWESDTDHDNIITVGPTVTNSSVRLAIEMGFSKILLSGVDFCYSKSGYSHASGTIEASLGPRLGHNTIWVETYAGYQAETLIQLKHAMEALEQEANNNPQVEMFNLCSNAAKIQGISHIAPQAITLNIFGSKKIDNIDWSSNDIKKDLLYIQKECIKTKSELTKLLSLSKKAQVLSTNLTLNSKSSANVLDEINKIEYKINKKYSELAKLAKFYGYFEFSHFLTTRETETWSQSHINEMTKRYYDALSSSCSNILNLVENACNKIQFRLNELGDTPLSDLASRWKNEGQPGRGIIWQNMHKTRVFSVDEQSLLLELHELYQKSLTEVRQTYVDKLTAGSSMERVYTKIIRLNQSQHHQGLTLIVDNLKSIIDNSLEANRLYHLALSFKLNLEQQPEQALKVLLALPEHLYTEMELKQIILLALKQRDLELASSTLVKILAHSDEYMPQYAHILKLQGKVQESINIYLDYLEKYPSDTQTWVKLGLFMVEINQIEPAHTAFSNAVNADPTNQVAQHYLTELTQLMTPPL